MGVQYLALSTGQRILLTTNGSIKQAPHANPAIAYLQMMRKFMRLRQMQA
jgi:hypothetical protein